MALGAGFLAAAFAAGLAGVFATAFPADFAPVFATDFAPALADDFPFADFPDAINPPIPLGICYRCDAKFCRNRPSIISPK